MERFWTSSIGKILRWILFIPITIAIATLAEFIILAVLSFANVLGLFWLIVCLFIFGMAMSAGMFNAGAISGLICPKRFIGAIILTIIVVAGTYYDISRFLNNAIESLDNVSVIPSWIYILYKVVGSGLVFLAGIWGAAAQGE